jgi:poly(A) polymerase
MIRKFIEKVFKKKPTAVDPTQIEPRIYTRKQHGIAREKISDCALRTTRLLQEAGFQAFVVGGAVRDLLLGREPKDFDVATNATPAETKRVIRRARVIGRRFQIVHALCGDEVVEVSTFRAFQPSAEEAAPPGARAEGADAAHRTDEHGRVLRDNVFGSQAEDALRRDFTVNALYYDPKAEEVWDYGNGVEDVKQRILRIIGDPRARFREDPVRMLRAVRFAAKLGFSIEASTRAPIAKMSGLLANVPSSRLFDEIIKLLLSGHAHACVHRLREEGLHHGLLPLLDVILEQPLGERFVDLALQRTDERIRDDKPVSPSFLLAALLWHEVLASSQRHEKNGMKPVPALHAAMHDVLDAQRKQLAIPHRYDAHMKEIWLMQPRFAQRFGARPLRLLETPRFRAGMDFLVLRCEAGELDAELGNWWLQFSAADVEERRALLEAAAGAARTGDEGQRKRRRPRRRRTARPDVAAAES